MEYIIIIIISILLVLILKQVFSVKIITLKNYKESEELTKITDKFPDNVEMTKDILKKIGNEKVKVKENLESETSLYIAITNTISISCKKNSCARIQTIAHECLHSIQSRTMQLFNFIISNIYLIYFLILSILTICKVIKNPILYVTILILLSFTQFIIRAFLEMDAMTKAKYVAKEYMETKNVCTKEEIDKLMKEYDKINNMGIPFYVWNLFFNNSIKIVIYSIIAIYCRGA